MPRSIHSRLEDLEKKCPECTEPEEVLAVYPGDPDPAPEFCPGCGRPLGVILRVVYEGEGDR